MKKKIPLITNCFFLLLICYAANAQKKINTATKFARPNILWIVCEDMSPHLSCFGETVIQTPNLDALAKDGVMYTNAYTCAGVCAPSRNSIITAMYPISIGGGNMRNYEPGAKDNESLKGLPFSSYSIVPPPYVKCFPEYLRSAGYYCTNNYKQDYQFEAPVTVWDESSKKAHWKNRPKESPFFAIFNLEITHESRLWLRDKEPLLVDTSKVKIPPYYPDIPEARIAIARQLSNVIEMDKQAGILIKELKDSGLYNSTIIFFYSDHGDGLPYVKREITNRGLHIPLIIKYFNQINANNEDNQMISGIDFGPTVLSLASVPIPKYMHGQAFVGFQKKPKRKYIFASRDRMDEHVDRVRTVFDGRYQYLHNYMPEKPYYQNVGYRLQIPMMKKMIELRDQGKLSSIVMRWFKPKVSVEELYDTEKDPYELNNLANIPAYKNKLAALKKTYNKWMDEVGDKNAIPEIDLRTQMWDNEKVAPTTAKPELIKVKDGYIIQCATEGASISYIFTPKNEKSKMGVDNVWKVYLNGSIKLNAGDNIIIKAQRIGYQLSNLNTSL